MRLVTYQEQFYDRQIKVHNNIYCNNTNCTTLLSWWLVRNISVIQCFGSLVRLLKNTSLFDELTITVSSFDFRKASKTFQFVQNVKLSEKGAQNSLWMFTNTTDLKWFSRNGQLAATCITQLMLFINVNVSQVSKDLFTTLSLDPKGLVYRTL